MVIVSRTDRGTRYRLLETLRQYGEERLDDRGETAGVRDAHLAPLRRGGAPILEQLWQTPDQAAISKRFDDDWENFGAAHTWSITIGDVDRASDLIAGTGYFASSTFRRDHQEWGARTLELADVTGRPDATTLCSQGLWAFIDGDPDRTVVLGELAITVDAPAAGMFGRFVSLIGHMGAGRNEAAAEIATEIRAVLPGLTDPVERYMARLAILHLQDLDTIVTDAEEALATARALGAPQGIADALRTASTRWYFSDPPNFDQVFVELAEAIRLHESVGVTAIWEWLTLTWGRTLAGDPQALATLHEAIIRLFDGRHWGRSTERSKRHRCSSPDTLRRSPRSTATSKDQNLRGDRPASTCGPRRANSWRRSPTTIPTEPAAPRWTATGSSPSRSQPSRAVDLRQGSVGTPARRRARSSPGRPGRHLDRSRLRRRRYVGLGITPDG